MWNRRPPEYNISIDLIAIWDWFKDRSRAKLRESLRRSRVAYRKALRYKEKPIE